MHDEKFASFLRCIGKFATNLTQTITAIISDIVTLTRFYVYNIILCKIEKFIDWFSYRSTREYQILGCRCEFSVP